VDCLPFAAAPFLPVNQDRRSLSDYVSLVLERHAAETANKRKTK
jgi:hypothetical protein